MPDAFDSLTDAFDALPDATAVPRPDAPRPRYGLGATLARQALNLEPAAYAGTGALAGSPFGAAGALLGAAGGGLYGLYQRNRALGLPPPTIPESSGEMAVDIATAGTGRGLQATAKPLAGAIQKMAVRPSAEELAVNPNLIEESLQRGMRVGATGSGRRLLPLSASIAAEKQAAKEGVTAAKEARLLEAGTERRGAIRGVRQEFERLSRAEREQASKLSQKAIRDYKGDFTLDQIAQRRIQRRERYERRPLTPEEIIDVKIEVQDAIKALGIPIKGGRLSAEALDDVRRLSSDPGRFTEAGRGRLIAPGDVAADLNIGATELLNSTVPGLAPLRATESTKIALKGAMHHGRTRGLERVAERGDPTAGLALGARERVNRAAATRRTGIMGEARGATAALGQQPPSALERELALQRAFAGAEARPFSLTHPWSPGIESGLATGLYGSGGVLGAIPHAVNIGGRWFLPLPMDSLPRNPDAFNPAAAPR